MDTNSKKLLEALPDFNDMLKLVEEVKELNVRKMNIESILKGKETEVFRTVMTDDKFKVNGKPPAVSYYDNAYKFTGINGELLEYRDELIRIQTELEMKKAQFDVFKQMIDMFKSLVFQEKGMV